MDDIPDLEKFEPSLPQCSMCTYAPVCRHTECGSLFCKDCVSIYVDIGGGQDESLYFYCPKCLESRKTFKSKKNIPTLIVEDY